MSKILISKLESLLNTGELFQIVDEEYSSMGVLRRLGYAEKGQYVAIVKKFLIDNEIDTSHFTTNGRPKVKHLVKICPVCFKKFTTEPRSKGEQITCSYSCSNTYFRSGANHPNYKEGKGSYRNIAFSNKPKVCEICGYDENKEALEVHHIDHNRNNNSLENLKILCANCHRILHKIKQYNHGQVN